MPNQITIEKKGIRLNIKTKVIPSSSPSSISRLKHFKLLAKDPRNNLIELERMRKESALALRKKLKKLGESEDFHILLESREKERDGGDYTVRAYKNEGLPDNSHWEFSEVHDRQFTSRLCNDDLGEAFYEELRKNGLDFEGTYEKSVTLK